MAPARAVGRSRRQRVFRTGITTDPHSIEQLMEAAYAGAGDDQTLTGRLLELEGAGACVPMLTIVWHPQLTRFGQRVPLTNVGIMLALNRHTPLFTDASTAGAPLGHRSISRTPLQLLRQCNGGIQLRVPTDVRCEIDGAPSTGEITLDAEAVARGVMLQLGQVVLCLHTTETLPELRPDASALLGTSSAMVRVRRQVCVSAGTDLPVLILGESGTGKELVARAIHHASARAHHKLVTINMAAVSESLAAADLFGTVKGAYTGAQTARRGLWADAHEGTLFLDEIGDLQASIQPMLLRAIESGEFRPVGSNAVQRANVRVVAATDRTLHGSTFNQPLLNRLEGFIIRTPPLRTRREDLGVLVQHILCELQVAPEWPALVPLALVRALGLHSWPGNVRQLSNVVRRLVASAGAGQWPTVHELFSSSLPEALISTSVTSTPVTPPPVTPTPVAVDAAHVVDAVRPPAYTPPASISAAALLTALDRAGWCLRAAALDLGVSRPSLYNLIDRHPDIRRAQRISQAEIEAEMRTAPDITALAARLRTPRDALRRHLQTLGLHRMPLSPGSD